MKQIKKFFGILLFALTFSLLSPAVIPQIGNCVEVQAATTVATPKLVSVKSSGTTKAVIKWGAVKGASGYRIYRSTNGKSWKSLITISGASKTTYTDSKLKSGSRYYYTVKAYKKVNGKTVWSGYNKKGLNVIVGLQYLKLNKSTLNIYIGDSYNLKINETSLKPTWKSSNTTIATVSSTGKVIGKKSGSVTISATLGEKTLKCKVTVQSFMSVSTKTLNMDGTDEETIKITLKKPYGLSYSVSDSGIITCTWDDDWYGTNNTITYLYVTANKSGTTYITISNKYNNEKAKIKVVVDMEDEDWGDDDDYKQFAFNKLKNYILVYGDTNQLGNKIIQDSAYDDEHHLWKWTVIYNYKDNTLELMVSQKMVDGMTTYGEIFFDENMNTYVKYEFSMFKNSAMVNAVAQINPATYTENTKLKFIIYDNDLYSDQSVQELGNLFIQVGFPGWKILLEETGVSLRDLGFIAL